MIRYFLADTERTSLGAFPVQDWYTCEAPGTITRIA